jgi:hypothetical protein
MIYELNPGVVPAGSTASHVFTSAGNTNSLIINNEGIYTTLGMGVLFTQRIRRNNTTNCFLYDNLTSGLLTIGGASSTNIIYGGTTFPQIVNFQGAINLNNSIAFTNNFGPIGTNTQGYNNKAKTASAITVTSTTLTNLTLISLIKGVWRLDWSVLTNCTSALGGVISYAKSLISILGSVGSPSSVNVDYTGSLVETNVSETFILAGSSVITSSMTLQLTSTTSVYLNIIRTFTTGTFTSIGEINVTRIG